MDSLYDNAHAVLSKLGLPGGEISLPKRIVNFGDRLMLRPEGEPDTADLVGKINEVCDRAGVPEWEPIKRVEMLIAERDQLVTDLAALRVECKDLREDLEAERARHAAAEKPQNVDRAALIRVIKMCAEELT